MSLNGNGRMKRVEIGYVYLIGAGPGDPGLLTIKAREALQRCEVIVYDRLCNPAILRECRPDAEMIYVGKQPGLHRVSQGDINRILVEQASRGRMVARLKGGDPFLFGRGGEEAEALSAKGIPFEVIPGVTSAIAVPAYAGIPVTHRSCSSSLSIITGHEDPGKGFSRLDWEALARGSDTLVFLMGIGNLEAIAGKLIDNGRPPETPVAVIGWGTTSAQKTITGPLSEIARIVDRSGITHPATVVIGEVVKLREQLNWFETRPLFGRRILLVHIGAYPSEVSSAIAAQGGMCLDIQVARPVAVPDCKPVLAVVDRLAQYEQIVFTDPLAVEFFVQGLTMKGKDLRVLSGLQIACTQPNTAKALRQYHLNPDSLLRCDEPKKRLIVQGWGSTIEHGLVGDKLIVYLLQPSRELAQLPALLHEERVDAIVFTCPASVYPFAYTVAAMDGQPLRDSIVCCLDSATADAGEDLGLPVQVVPRGRNPEQLVESLRDRFKRWGTKQTQNTVGGVNVNG